MNVEEDIDNFRGRKVRIIEEMDGPDPYEKAMAQIQAWAQHDYIHTTDEFIALVELAMKKKPDASRSC